MTGNAKNYKNTHKDTKIQTTDLVSGDR